MRTRRIPVLSALVGVLAACGGGTTAPPPPPPPPPPPAAVRLDLAPGEVQVLTSASDMRRFEIAGGNEARRYEVVVMSGSQVGIDSDSPPATPLKLVATAGGAGASISPQSPRVGSSQAPPYAGDPTMGLSELQRALLRPLHLAFRRRMLEELRRTGAFDTPLRSLAGSRAARASVSGAPAVPNVGDTITMTSGVLAGQAVVDCFGTATAVDAVVKAVGDNFIILEDVANAGHFTDQDYQALDAELDQFVAPVDQTYFGTPGDLDGNGHVIVFITKEVNLLTPAGAGSIIIGFHNPNDFSPSSVCSSSNEGEILWLVAPDPGGEFGHALSFDLVKSFARSVVSHEYQHLISASLRVVVGGGTFADLDDLWLAEGMSHIGEEVSGLYRVGASTRGGLGFSDVGVGGVERAAFDDFLESDLRWVVMYMTDPGDVELHTFQYPTNPFPMRGFAYNFLRFIGDRYGPATPENLLGGSGEDAIFRELASGGPARLYGTANVLRAINVVSGESPTWPDVLQEYFAAVGAVDADAAIPSEISLTTWDHPKLWAEMGASSVPGLSAGYPLMRSSVSMGTGASSTVNFDVRSSTAHYFRLTASGAHPDMLVELSAPSGANVPNGASARVIVVRTR